MYIFYICRNACPPGTQTGQLPSVQKWQGIALQLAKRQGDLRSGTRGLCECPFAPCVDYSALLKPAMKELFELDSEHEIERPAEGL